MPYKIALIGAHGTGKTALLGMVEGELRRRGVLVTSIREMPTQAKRIGLPINEETTVKAQLWILHQQFSEELVLEHNISDRPQSDVIICDRGPDNYCYLKHTVGENAYALAMTLGHLNLFPYNKLYFLPIIDKTITDDRGTRALKPIFQKQMDLAIREFLQQHNISFMELPQPHEQDNFRNEWVKTIVNQTLKDLSKSEELFIE